MKHPKRDAPKASCGTHGAKSANFGIVAHLIQVCARSSRQGFVNLLIEASVMLVLTKIKIKSKLLFKGQPNPDASDESYGSIFDEPRKRVEKGMNVK